MSNSIDCIGCVFEDDKKEIKSRTYNPETEKNRINPAPCSKCVRLNDDHYTKKAD